MLYALTPSDALAKLADLYPPDAHPGLPFLADLLKQPACRAWYAADGEQVTAAIWYLYTGTHAELIDLIVAPSARGLGIGRDYLRTVIIGPDQPRLQDSRARGERIQ